MLMMPLIADNHVFGTLTFSSNRPHTFPAETLALGRFLSLQVAGAVQNALLLEELDGRDNVIVSLALAIEAKDPYTEGHCQRLAQYAERLGRVLHFDEGHLTKLRMAAILHDVGKIAVPEAILQKPGNLTDDEYKILQLHPVTGESICQPLRSLRPMLPAIRHHHERWDGRGYPDGLVGEEIPLDARIIAIVDAFDAMTSDRPYRPGMPVERALAILRENRGPQWDEALLSAFIPLIEADLVADGELETANLGQPVGPQKLWSARRTVARPRST
jgi:HD-GYP domain-containing protein (c-di-GMP phosphodiesterase class II)